MDDYTASFFKEKYELPGFKKDSEFSDTLLEKLLESDCLNTKGDSMVSVSSRLLLSPRSPVSSSRLSEIVITLDQLLVSLVGE
jgi:hypothetical protein